MTVLDNIQLAYGKRILCEGISLSLPVEGGALVMLCGANGSGKSTLMRRIAAECPGAVMIPTGIPKVKGFTLRQFVETACYRHSNWKGRLGSGLEVKIDEALESMGLSGKAGRDISTLSDGEFQKACIAVALTTGGDIILLDEPTAFLDPENRLAVLLALREVADSGKTVIFSSHDIAEGMKHCTATWAIGTDKKFHKSDEEGTQKCVESIFLSTFDAHGE